MRSCGGRFVYRLEDLDPPRAVPGAADSQLASCRWLGLDWDEGPDVGGPHAPYRQSERFPLYRAALDRLAAAGRLFPCRRSRKDLLALATAPHGDEGLPPYPARFRPKALLADWYARHRAAERPDAALRFQVEPGVVRWTDRVFGAREDDVAAQTGDFVLERRDGLFAYQLAVVVDDLAMGVTEVVRGADLLDSTARQVQLIRALGGAVPDYAHLPLLVNAAGEKLSKRDGALGLPALHETGVPPEAVVGYLAWVLGQTARPAPMPAAEVAARWDWRRVRPEPHALPGDLAERLLRLT